jgi:hypothetical protein
VTINFSHLEHINQVGAPMASFSFRTTLRRMSINAIRKKKAIIKRIVRGSMALMITEVTTKVAESFNPLLNSKRRIIAMNPKTMIRE